ncbi:MAG: phosphatase PAP2 family protein [Bacteroidales bacterium]|nr:phosphatase PAP2 family protein [Bacteroidales bacterium]
MRRFVSLVFLLVISLWSAYAQESAVETYFPAEELPDLIRCLPPPPEKGSPAFRYDVQRYRWGKAQRNNPERADMARRDAVWSYEALLAELSLPFGMEISAEGTPELWKLLTVAMATTDQMRVAPKAYYHRTRPFVYFRETAFLEEDARFSDEGSYPSGHTMRSWTAALILSEVNPAAAEGIYARAWECGISRVISGAHWQSDVDVTRLAASIGYSRLQTSEAFRAQMALAQDEYRRLAFPGRSGRECFVKISDVIPDVILEIRYYSTHNFVGQRIDGYLAPTALLTRQAADSLKVVSDELKARGYRLKIYDAYRPQCAVDHFVRWAADVPDTLMKRFFYPDVDKSRLFELEYIMEKSGHTRGSTVDLTLFDMNTGKDVDMGGFFDWFGEESHPDYTGITTRQFENRMILRDAMLRHGFKPLESEWWHFTLQNEPFPDTYFNFPVR